MTTNQLLRARAAVVVAFAANGLAFASFVSRIPTLGEDLGLSTAQLGLLLLCLSGGSVTGLPLSGPLVQRVGPGPAVLAGALAVTVGLTGLVVALATATVPFAAVGLFATGLGMGVWDVAMNVAGADVEQRLGSTTLMPRLHAAFSIGTVAGAAVGAVCSATGVPLAAQVLGVVVLLPGLMVRTVRGFGTTAAAEAGPGGSGGVLAAWREPRTLLIGLLVLGFAFTEGSANEWIAYALVNGYGASETVGAVAFGLFVTAMTAGRLLGGTVLARFGRVAVLRAAAGLALVGLLLVLVGGSVPTALVGALFWGVGAALGFPVGMSAAADDPARAAARVSVVSSIGYTAFLAGAPLIGLLAEDNGILRALFVVLGALLLGLLASGAARPTGVRPAGARTTPVS
ncbi:MAG: MFS transporter [Pseudonocardia sp.]|nr:MFS transporter [Pseudonocardia sp.]